MEEYAVAGFDFGGFFESETYDIRYGDIDYVIKRAHVDGGRGFPISNQIYTLIKKERLEYAHVNMLVFLSELAWQFSVPVYSIEHGGGSMPLRVVARFPGCAFPRISVDLKLFNPILPNENQRWALGFYRDGISNNNVFYGYVSLYKVFELALSGKGIHNYCVDYARSNPKEMAILNISDPEIFSEFLYKNCRCAIVHAKDKPFADPHSFSDIRMIKLGHGILEKVVAQFMRDVLKIPNRVHERGYIQSVS